MNRIEAAMNMRNHLERQEYDIVGDAIECLSWEQLQKKPLALLFHLAATIALIKLLDPEVLNASFIERHNVIRISEITGYIWCEEDDGSVYLVRRPEIPAALAAEESTP